MLVTKTVLTNWNNKNKRYYIEKGYVFTKNRDEFEVKVEDLTKGSHSVVVVQCDYCGESINKPYKTYLKSKNDSPIKKDCCLKCNHLKSREFYLLTYGVENNMHLEQYKTNAKKKIEDVKKEFNLRGYDLTSKTYIYCTEKMDYICRKHSERGIQKISWTQFNRGFGCKFCGYERLGEKRKGENNTNWKGGVSPLHIILRDKLKEWKRKSLELYNFKCAISGETGELEVHHLYGFNMILLELQNIIDIDTSKQLKDYSTEDIDYIGNELRSIHDKYGLGIPLKKDIHRLFHNIYGRGDNTPEQFEEFKQSYITEVG